MDQELPHIYTVSALTREVRDRLETYFSLVWVSGEVSNLRQPLSGHYYFTLKDASAQLRAVLFKGTHQHMRCKPQEGSQFLCRGRLTVYEPRGEYQLVVDYLEPLGQGALAQAFEVLKTRLQDEGLFAPELKKPLPFLPENCPGHLAHRRGGPGFPASVAAAFPQCGSADLPGEGPGGGGRRGNHPGS